MKTVFPIGRTGIAWSLLSAVLVTMSLGCSSSSDSGGGDSASSCAYRVEYRNHTYTGAEAKDFTLGDELGAATFPPCDDSTGDDSGRTPPASTTAYAIEGVDPSIAIALKQAADDVIFVNVDSGKKLPEIKKMIHGS